MAFVEKPIPAQTPTPENSSEEQGEVELASLLMRQKVDVFSNSLLGQFDASGSYTISEALIKELVSMAKIATDSNENVYYLVGKAGTLGEEFVVKFVLSIEKEDTMQTATLRVVERVDRGNAILSSTLSTFVAKYSDEDNEFFATKVFTIFNILSEGDDSQMLSLNAQFCPSIIQLKTRQRAMKVKLAGMVDVDKKYFEARLALLKKGGPYGAFVLRQYALMLKENHNRLPLKSENKYYRIMNELLDNCFERAGLIKDPQLKASLNKINTEFRDAVQKAEAALSIPQPKKEQAKAAGPVVAIPAGGAAKPAGGGAAKPASAPSKADGGKGDSKVSMLGQFTQMPKEKMPEQKVEAPKQPVQATPKPASPVVNTKTPLSREEIIRQIENDFKNELKENGLNAKSPQKDFIEELAHTKIADAPPKESELRSATFRTKKATKAPSPELTH